MHKEIGAFEAKTQLSRLLERVRKGERITITKHGMPVAQLVPVQKTAPASVASAIEELAEIRKRTRHGPETLRQLREEGRRF